MKRALTFHVFLGEEFVRTEVVEQAIVKIGRISSAHLVLDDTAVARIHAVIEVSDAGDVAIIDLGSPDGTRVNGELVAKARLDQGDEIAIGPFRIVLELTESRPEPVAAEAPPAASPSQSPLKRMLGMAEAARAMECPRCGGRVAETESSGGGGVYREVQVRAMRCVPCRVTFLDVQKLATRLGRPGLRLSGSAVDRGHEPTRTGCPSCLASMEKLTLSWGAAWAMVEECPRCGMLVLDDGELGLLSRMVEAGETADIVTTSDALSAGEADAWQRAIRSTTTLFERLITPPEG